MHCTICIPRILSLVDNLVHTYVSLIIMPPFAIISTEVVPLGVVYLIIILDLAIEVLWGKRRNLMENSYGLMD